MPPDEAVKQGWLDKAFENKAKALNYQKEVKRRFPNQPCCFLDYRPVVRLDGTHHPLAVKGRGRAQQGAAVGAPEHSDAREPPSLLEFKFPDLLFA
jgi:hypothetical protein